MDELQFYSEHSTQGDPGNFADIIAETPDDIEGMCKVVQGIYMHYMSEGVADYPLERRKEVDTRYMPDILKRVQELSAEPLTVQRPKEQRFIGCCRDAAMLFTMMARAHGIPARMRVGFARYIRLKPDVDFRVDHVVSEIWDAKLNRWRLIDPEQTPALIRHNKIDFDVTDIPRDQFIVAGQAWEDCRDGKDDPQTYGVHPDEDFVRGDWFIIQRLIQDLAVQNKVELLLWDTWGLMEYEHTKTDGDYALINQVAHITQHGTFAEKQTLYAHPQLTAPEEVMCYSPVQDWQKVHVRL